MIKEVLLSCYESTGTPLWSSNEKTNIFDKLVIQELITMSIVKSMQIINILDTVICCESKEKK